MSYKAIIRACPCCAGYNRMLVTEHEVDDAYRVITREAGVYYTFPYMNPFEREFLLTGYCPECVTKLFYADPTGMTRRFNVPAEEADKLALMIEEERNG